MENLDIHPCQVQFGNFKVDLRAGEIQKNGRKIRLPDQPFRVLAMLLERPGQVVTREELRTRLWPADTFVDFDHGLNNAINKIRESLGDSAENPRFIETLPRRGYRFISHVETPVESLPALTLPEAKARPVGKFWIAVGLAGISAMALAVAFALDLGGLRSKSVGASTVPTIDSLAVLPFENLTGDPNQEYLVDGVSDELTTQLGQLNSLKVISRQSVLRYKHQRLPMRQIAQELNVEGVLEGAVRREGGRLHVTAQLIAAREDRHIWARSYDRDMREAPAVPCEIARAVIETLHIRLTPQERLLLGSAQPVDQAVYAAYLNGRYFQSKYTNEGFHRSIEYFQEAIAKDPGYAPAWVEMGVSYTDLSGFGLAGNDLSQEEALKLASAAFKRALELDPRLSKPYRFLGLMKLNDWDWAGASREIEKASELDPHWRGGTYFLTLSGRLDEAILVAQQNVDKDPFDYSSQNILGWTYFMAKRYEESIVALRRAVTMNPANHYAHFQLGRDYALKGMFPEAISECDTALKLLRRKEPEAVAAPDCGWVSARAGRRRQALEIARTSDDTDAALIYDALGERDKAIVWLERAYRAHDLWIPRLWNLPMVSEELRADPRFQELMRRTGNPWVHFARRSDSPALAGVKTTLQD